jgi:hypothetical protein
METQITHFCLIIDFLDVGFDTNEISQTLKIYLDNLLRNNSEKLANDWKLIFQANYNNGTKILISKNKFGTRKSEKIKEVVIVIPVPSKDIIEWGVENNQYVYGTNHYDNIIGNFWGLEIDFYKFSNRHDYIVDSLKRGILKSLKEGISVNGIKINSNGMNIN